MEFCLAILTMENRRISLTSNNNQQKLTGKVEKMHEDDRVYSNDVDEYCQLNPGILMTRKSLQRVCPHIETCANDISHQGQTVREVPALNLARCMKSFLNVSCASNKKVLFF